MRCGIDSDEEELEDVAFCSFLFSGGAARKKKMSRPDVVLKRGMLVKRGNFIKTWNRHAFVLTSKELRWYGSSGEKGTPKGSIRLKDITKLRQKADGAFKIVTPSREHILVAPSDTLKREWMKAIHKAQFRPSRLAQLLREAAALEKTGRISTELKEEIKDALVCGDPDRIASAESRLRQLTNVAYGSKAPSALENVLEQFESMTTSLGLINVLERLAQTAKSASVPPSLSARVRAIAAKHHAHRDKRWDANVQAKFAHAMAVITQRTVASSPTPAVTGETSTGSMTPVFSPVVDTAGGSPASPSGSEAQDEGHGRKVGEATKPFLHDSRESFDASNPEHVASLGRPQSSKFADDYVLGARIGEGGYSVVYEGAHKASRELVAVKCVEKKRLSAHEKRGLIEEVKVMRKLRHPNIVRLIAFYDEPGVFYIVTELMTGGELFDQIVQKTHYSEQEAQAIVRTMVEAIAYCHSKGIVHRDLKPENILLSTPDEASQVIKIADMGFARPVRPGGMETSCGTPSYVAPEILCGERYGKTVDMWSLGVITFILLCGYAPFAGSTQAKLFRAICRGQFRFASPYWDAVSASAKDLIRKLLVVDTSERLTAADVLRHPWIAQEANASNLLSGVLKQLRRYNTRRRQVIKRGFLVKRGHIVRNWKRRSFALTNTELLYYESETSTQPLGVIRLSEITRVMDQKGKPSFKIFTTGGRKYVIQAASEEEKQEWMRSVMSTQQQYDLMTKAAVALKAQEMEEAASLVSLADEFASLRNTSARAPSASTPSVGAAAIQAGSGSVSGADSMAGGQSGSGAPTPEQEGAGSAESPPLVGERDTTAGSPHPGGDHAATGGAEAAAEATAAAAAAEAAVAATVAATGAAAATGEAADPHDSNVTARPPVSVAVAPPQSPLRGSSGPPNVPALAV